MTPASPHFALDAIDVATASIESALTAPGIADHSRDEAIQRLSAAGERGTVMLVEGLVRGEILANF